MQTPGLFKKSPAFTFQQQPNLSSPDTHSNNPLFTCPLWTHTQIIRFLPVPSGHTLKWLYLASLLFGHPLDLHILVNHASTIKWLSISVLLALLQLLASVCPLLSLLNKCLSTTVLHLSAAAPSLLLNECLSIPVPRFILITEWWIGQIRNALVDEAI